MFDLAFMVVGGAAFWFAAASTIAYTARLRWALAALWIFAAIATTALGLLVTVIAIAEPIP